MWGKSIVTLGGFYQFLFLLVSDMVSREANLPTYFLKKYGFLPYFKIYKKTYALPVGTSPQGQTHTFKIHHLMFP